MTEMIETPAFVPQREGRVVAGVSSQAGVQVWTDAIAASGDVVAPPEE